MSGVQDLYISFNSRFDVTPSARVNTAEPGTIAINSVTILNGGTFHHTTPIPSQLSLNLTADLTINAGATANVSKLVFYGRNAYVDTGAVLTAHARGYGSEKGPRPGLSSSHSASGAGHGGAGGRGTSQPLVGKAYGSLDKPEDYGSGGGVGYMKLVSLLCFETV